MVIIIIQCIWNPNHKTWHSETELYEKLAKIKNDLKKGKIK